MKQNKVEKLLAGVLSISLAMGCALRRASAPLPAPEIAQAMWLTHGAVRTRLSRGRAALKKTLLQEDAVWT